MRVFGYTRVSTEDQAREGVSLDVQASKIGAYCAVKDWRLAELVTDAGESAKSLKRPGLQRLLDRVKQRQVDVVIVLKLDRLTRDVSDMNLLVKLFDKHHVALVSLQESLDATTASGRLMMNVIATISQWEREVISERTRAAMQHLKAQGKGYCRPRFCEQPGYEQLLAYMRRERAKGKSYQQIAEQLQMRGTPTIRGGRLWYGNTVRLLLRSA